MKLALSPDLKLPQDAVTETFGILGKRGSGKTTTASVFAEELLGAGLPLVIVDPTGAWWGLRASADGKGEGYPITILGGDHGDAPLEEGAGKVIAELVAEEAPPLVLDLSILSKSAARRFVTDFSQRLYERNRTALHVIYDEADEFVPQRITKGSEACFGAVDTVVRRGRIRGLGVTLISQRSAAINKDVLSQCEVVFAHRASHPRDLAPVLEWMEAAQVPAPKLQKVRETIASLENGEAWVMSPEFLDLFTRTRIRHRRTFNSSATPKAGERRIVPKRLAPVDLEALRKRMGDTIERAKANDPTALRRRIADLEHHLAQAERARDAAQKAPRLAEPKAPALKTANLKRIEAVVARAEKLADKFVATGTALGKEVEQFLHPLLVVPPLPSPAREHALAAIAAWKTGRPAAPLIGAARAAAEGRPPAGNVPPAMRSNGSDGEAVSGYALGLLRTLAEREPMRLTPGQLAALSGRSARSSMFDGSMARLKKLGLIAWHGRHVTLTDTGRAAVGSEIRPVPTSPAELQAAWLRVLPDYERALLEALFAAHPEPLSREELGTRTGKSPGSSMFDAALASLRRNGLIENERGAVRAAAAVFAG